MDFTLDSGTAQQLLKSLPMGIVTTNAKGEITWANDAMLRLLKTRSSGGKLSLDAVEELQPFLESKGTFTVLDPNSGSQIWLRHVAVDLAGGAGRSHIFEDVTEAKDFQQERDQLAETVRRQSPTDELTGLLTQHALMQGLLPLVSLSRRYDMPLSMVMLEIKNLKAFSDHGPNAVVATGRLLKEQMRWADMIARVGEGQFLLALPETSKAAAAQLVDKIYPLLTQLKLPGTDLQPQAAFGITEWSRNDDVKRLIRRTEKALDLAREDDTRYAEVM
ncbi:MAG: sensor domain-containing diguanylate cyclase [Pseudomonadota bacterium]